MLQKLFVGQFRKKNPNNDKYIGYNIKIVIHGATHCQIHLNLCFREQVFADFFDRHSFTFRTHCDVEDFFHSGLVIFRCISKIFQFLGLKHQKWPDCRHYVHGLTNFDCTDVEKALLEIVFKKLKYPRYIGLHKGIIFFSSQFITNLSQLFYPTLNLYKQRMILILYGCRSVYYLFIDSGFCRNLI